MEDFTEIHDSGHPRGDSENDGANYRVIQRTSKTGSSSCQCLTTLYGMQKEITNYVNYQRQVKSMQKDVLAITGVS